MEEKNYFKSSEVKYLIPIFIIIVTVNIICAILTEKMLLQDGGIHFLNMLNSFSSGEWDFNAYFGSRQRIFVFYLNNFPLNIAYHIFKINSKEVLGMIYTATWFLMPVLMLLFQYLLAKRSKRYDIAVCAFILYAVLIQPCQMYPVLEVVQASSVFLLLLHCYLAKIDYNGFDISAVTLMLLFLCCADEIVILGIFFTLISAYYPVKEELNKKNKFIKKYIYFGLIFALAVYVISYILVPEYYGYGGTERLTTEINFLLSDLQHGYIILLPLFFLFLLIFFILKRIKITKQKIYPATITVFIAILIFTWINNFYESNISFGTRWFLYMLYPLLVMLCTLSYRIKDISEKEDFYNYLLFLGVITGIFYAGLQIYFSYDFYNIKESLLKALKTEKSTVITDKDLIEFSKDKSSMLWLAKETYTYNIIGFAKNKEINTLVYANEDFKPYIDEKQICLPFSCFDMKNEFWDLTSAVKELEKNNNN